ncbi:MAG TPA: DUF1302 family protein [Acidobacteriota bacterium]|nr:DUF1302 family protein [Acidobacteriota bacterium]
MKQIAAVMFALILVLTGVSRADVTWGGFLQGLYGGRLDKDNPTSTEYTASETRLQLRAEHFGDAGEFFGRLDFVYDGADSSRLDWELREGYLKFVLGDNFDFKIGRQVLTWGTGDLIFINDVFAKDYRSFFIGRDDQYLKAPQNAVRVEYYHPLGNVNAVWTPNFEPNRLPTGRRLSYYSPFPAAPWAPGIVGTGADDTFYFEPPRPPSRFENAETALRFQRQVGNFATALYFYRGFYKNPVGAMTVDGRLTPYYPRLNVYGASARGAVWQGVLWIEGGYFDSREDRCGGNPLIPNSAATAMIGYERQIAANLTVNAQWQIDWMTDYDKFAAQQPAGLFVRDEFRHLVTSRLTRLLMDENLSLSAFAFFSPTDKDAYIRLRLGYKHTDEIALAVGGNIFGGSHENTEFGQFQKNDNAYLKVTYGF